MLTFVPPTVGGLLFPNGFIYAIGFAGLAAAFWAVIVPALMARASRKRFGSPLFRAWGGTPAIVLESGRLIPGYKPAAELAADIGITPNS